MTRPGKKYSFDAAGYQYMMLSWAFLILLLGNPYLALSFVLIAIMGYPAKLLHERRLSGKGLILYLGLILLWVLLTPFWFRELELMP